MKCCSRITQKMLINGLFFFILASSVFAGTSSSLTLTGANPQILQFNFYGYGNEITREIDLDNGGDYDIDILVKSNVNNWKITAVSDNGGYLVNTKDSSEKIKYVFVLDTYQGFLCDVGGSVTTALKPKTPKNGTVISFGVYFSYDGFYSQVFEAGTYTDTLHVTLSVN